MKQDVLDYLRYTPANTNVNVVSTMLGSDGGGGELPKQVKNAILTHGMGWTDDDGTINKIDEKYIYGEEDEIDEQILEALMSVKVVDPLADDQNRLLVDENNVIFVY